MSGIQGRDQNSAARVDQEDANLVGVIDKPNLSYQSNNQLDRFVCVHKNAQANSITSPADMVWGTQPETSMKRRAFPLAMAAVCAMASTSLFAQSADSYPNKPITIVVPYGAGGTTDVSARQLASMAEKVLGQPIVIENKPGGSGANAMRFVSTAPADGYTLIAATSSPSFVAPALRPVGYDPVKDFVPVMNYSGPYHGVLVNAASPYKSMAELTKAAQQGQSLNYGTAGAMGGAHLTFAAVAKQTKAALKHVPFKGSAPTTAAILGGHVDIALVPAYRDHVRDGQLRLLAVLDGTRDPDFPDVPTLKELGYGIEFPSIVGILAPAATDPKIVATLEAAFTQVASSGEFKEFMTKLSQPVRIMSGAQLGSLIQSNLTSYQTIGQEVLKTQ
jgi:tripartite-type tricarboxylate transporter receptor subunit TctC